MLKDIITKENLILHAEELKSPGYKPGIDDMSPEAAVIWLQINGDKLCKKIMNGNYEPMPLACFCVAKRNGKPRIISNLTVIDKAIQNAILDYINEKVDCKFSPNSFAYRKNKSIGGALSLYCQYSSEHSIAAKIDPYSCYDNIDFDVLENFLYNFIDEEKVVKLIMSFAKAPMIIDGEVLTRDKGIPQGAPLSTLLYNIYFNIIDTTLTKEKIDFIRYADDIMIFADSVSDAQNSIDLVKNLLQNELKLSPNKSKFKISAPTDIEFLGHRFTTSRYGIVADKKSTKTSVFTKWKSENFVDNKRTVDIVSDGVLRQKEYSIIFETEDREIDIPVKETEVINVYSNVILDSGITKKAFDNGIYINIFSPENHLLGRFVPNTALKSQKVIYQQLLTYYDVEKRLELAKKFLLASFHNTRLVIRYYNKHDEKREYIFTLKKIDNICKKIKNAEKYEEILLLEAQGREAYYNCFDLFLENSEFCFEKRTRKPSKNEINAMISFGNTLLYNYIAFEINKSALDIRIGFLHATNNRKESLNLDIAEIFRPLIVDRTIFALVNRRAITKEDFFNNNSGIYLNNNGKRKFIHAFYEKLDTRLQMKETSFSYRQIIHEEVKKLVHRFRDEESYKPYKQVR